MFEEAGCDFFAVTFIEEALELRKAGIRGSILAMAPIDTGELEKAAENDVIVTLTEKEAAEELSRKAAGLGKVIKAHLKLDTGLSRLGIVTAHREHEAAAECGEIISLPGIDVIGIYTHITSADKSVPGGDELNLRELRRFKTVCDMLEEKGYQLTRHCLSSGPLKNYPEYACEYVRLGDILYGPYGNIPGAYGIYPVKNCIYLKSRIIQVKEIPCGSSISYGPMFTTLRDTKIAVVPIGFADGLRRALSNIGCMLVKGHRAPIVGKICCDHTILDVTDIPDVKRGDIVTIFGRDGELEQTAGNYAKLIGASTSEITSILSQRIPRIMLQ